MNSKNIAPSIILALIVYYTSASAQNTEKAVPATELKDGDSIATIQRSYVELRAAPQTSDEAKAAQQIRILILARNYLNSHTRPVGEVQSNIQPPDGGIPGVAPEAVKDPKLRAQYVKMIEENNAKAEAQNTYDAFVALQNQVLIACVVYSNAKPENARILSEAITKSSKDANQAETLKRLLTDNAVEQRKQPPKWPAK
jgi:hypothetical protein